MNPEDKTAGHLFNLADFDPSKTRLPPLPPVRQGSHPELRQQAEEVLRNLIEQSQEHIGTLSPETLRMILHELRVHQIEVEMQNEELRRKTDELDASRARYFDLYDLAPVGYLTLSGNGLILEANLTVATLMGVNREALVQAPPSRFIHKEDQPIYYLWHKKLFETGVRQTCELRMARADGTTVWVHLEATVAQDEGGASIARVALSDISGHKAEEQEMHNLRTAVEQSANTIVITDLQGNIRYANPAFEKTTGYTEAEVVGKNPRILKSGEQDEKFYRNLWATISSGKIWRGEFHNRCKDGSLYWEWATISPIRNDKGEIVCFLAVKENITERKIMEAALATALKKAEASAIAKTEFLSVMSHEIRTPLNGVLGCAELLADTPLNEEQKDYVRTINSSGDHLLAIVNDVLDFSSIEKGTLAIQVAPLAFADLVKAAADTVRKTAADKGIAFRCDVLAGVPEQILGDERRIRQILINLLGNAVKFTSSGSVVLRIAPTPDGRFLDFSVEDTGIGISPEMIGRLFQPFVQANSKKNRSFGGTGLGLAISKRIAEAMGGSITVASTPEKGSTFTFRLPLEISPSIRESDAPPESGRLSGTGILPLPRFSSKMTELGGTPPPHALVLVVEDDPTSSVIADKMLRSLGYRVECVASGDKAIEGFVPGKFAAILMDIAMPGIDGLATTAKIREIEAATSGHVPIIAITANVLPGDRERCLVAGMDEVLSKPFKKEELAAKLAHVRPTDK